MMRTLFVFLFTWISLISLSAQTLQCEGPVEHLVQNISGAKNPRTDSKGRFCGLLLLHSTIKGLKFEGPVEGNVQHNSGIYYVYLHPGSTKMKVVSPDNSKLLIQLPKIESKATYQATVFIDDSRGRLSLSTEPSGATVTLISSANDHTDLGKTPLKGTVDILNGNYTVVISKSGYQKKVKKNVKIKANRTTNLGKIKLKKSTL